MKMSELSRSNADLKDSLITKISSHHSKHDRMFSAPIQIPSAKELRPIRLLPKPKSSMSDSKACTGSLDVKTMKSLECDLLNKLVAATKRKEMTESDYNRRREELNRLLEQDEVETREIEKEGDQALKDLKNVESAFADVQEKYERVMKTVLTLKEKELLLIERDHENMLKIKELDEGLEKFKIDAYKQVDGEYRGWLSKLAEAEGTNVKLKAMIRKAEMKIEKLEHELGQKQKENIELHNLCDELINNSSKNPE